jgi:hypothetical protein
LLVSLAATGFVALGSIHGAGERLAKQDHFYPEYFRDPSIALMMYVLVSTNMMMVMIGRQWRWRWKAVGTARGDTRNVYTNGTGQHSKNLEDRGAQEKSPRQRQAHGAGRKCTFFVAPRRFCCDLAFLSYPRVTNQTTPVASTTKPVLRRGLSASILSQSTAVAAVCCLLFVVPPPRTSDVQVVSSSRFGRVDSLLDHCANASGPFFRRMHGGADWFVPGLQHDPTKRTGHH